MRCCHAVGPVALIRAADSAASPASHIAAVVKNSAATALSIAAAPRGRGITQVSGLTTHALLGVRCAANGLG